MSHEQQRMSTLSTRTRQVILDTVRGLVTSNYDQLVADGRAGRLTAEELQSSIDAYRGTIVLPPEDIWSWAEVYPIEASPDAFFVEVPLWTKEEGRSDLTLSLLLHVDPERGPSVSIEDFHVL